MAYLSHANPTIYIKALERAAKETTIAGRAGTAAGTALIASYITDGPLVHDLVTSGSFFLLSLAAAYVAFDSATKAKDAIKSVMDRPILPNELQTRLKSLTPSSYAFKSSPTAILAFTIAFNSSQTAILAFTIMDAVSLLGHPVLATLAFPAALGLNYLRSQVQTRPIRAAINHIKKEANSPSPKVG